MAEALRARFDQFGQGHVFHDFDRLSDAEKAALLKDAAEVPLEELSALHKSTAHKAGPGADSRDTIVPFKDSDVHRLNATQRAFYAELGLKEIAGGRVAALLMAGGQGTRLGSKSPKGMFNVGLPSGKCLFQIQAERLIKLQHMAGASRPIPWYVMTSEATDAETEQFFSDRGYFGLDRNFVRFFEQGQYPALLEDGRIAMSSRNCISLAPNGNGGIYEAVARTGVLDEMTRSGIQFIFVYGVDNIACRVADPVFVGLLRAEGGDCGVKVVPKAYPGERVGVLAYRNELPSVVEYSELDPRIAEQVDPATGRLMFNTGNICMHLYTLDFLRRACDAHKSLVKHVAHKAIPFHDFGSGRLVEPPKPNGHKFEMFVFDVFFLAKKLVALEVVRDEEFLPLKNKDGTADANPTTCREGMSKLHKRYLENAGVKLVGEGLCEIDASVSYAGEGLEKLAGKTIALPVHVTSENIATLGQEK